MPRKSKDINESKLSFDERQKLTREYKKALEEYRTREMEAAFNKDSSFDEEPPEPPFPGLRIKAFD